MNAVLFVDDDQGIRELNARTLKARGFDCHTAADGEEALAKLEQAPFDLVVLDVIMPRREGIQTLIEIKRRWPQTRVIAISGGGRIGPDDFLGLAREFGADATLAKPVTPSTVAETIRRVLDR